MNQYFDLQLLITYHELFWRGLQNTLLLTATTMGLGLSLGLLLGLARIARAPLPRLGAKVYIGLFRNTPILIQLFFFQAFVPMLLGIENNAFFVAITAFGLYNIAYCADIYRSGLETIPGGQHEAARALGLGRWQQMRYVVIPQAVRRMAPAFTNRTIEIAKLTTVASAVSYGDLLYYAKLVSDTEYRPIETYSVVALIFLLVLIPFSVLAKVVEDRLQKAR